MSTKALPATGFYDVRGIPIHEGDVLKSFHFHDSTAHSRKRYLYHVVVFNLNQGGAVELIPLMQIVGGKNDGGCCWLKAAAKRDTPSEFEIIDGHDWPWDRARLAGSKEGGK